MRTGPDLATTLVQRAAAEGLLPPDAAPPAHEARPWPVVLLTALGAWLAALPLIGVVGLLLGDVISRSAGLYGVGLLLLAAAWIVLRANAVPVFVEQLAMPALLTGVGALGFGLFRDLPPQLAAALLCAIALGFGASIGRAWLRVLMGAAAASQLMLALMPTSWLGSGRAMGAAVWWVVHGVLAVWIAGLATQRRALQSGDRAGSAIAVESIAAGWLLSTLVALSLLSGTTFLLGGAMGGGFAADLAGAAVREIHGGAHDIAMLATAAGSVALGLAAAACTARAWPSLRRAECAGAAVTLVLLCAFLPMLGAVLLALAITATTQRWRLAGACAVAAAWIVGSFYYQLAWPLATKAVVLVAAGAALGGMAWWARQRSHAPAEAPAPLVAAPRRARALITLAGVAVLVVANGAIWQKEDTIAHGQAVFVPLAPVDPRSLMQGDFMQLNFNVPADLQGRLDALVTLQRPQVIAVRDTRGVATFRRIADAGQPLAADEIRIELTPKNGRWILVTDAWFFREGEADRFAQARFGELRVAADGRALLVGLADERLQRIEP